MLGTRIFILTFLLSVGIGAFPQSNLRIFAEKEGDNTVLYADNMEVCMISVYLTLSLDNLNAMDEAPDKTYLVPASTNRFRLVTLGRANRKRTRYAYNYMAVFGDVRQTGYDRNYLYDLPFARGRQYRVEQGYRGSFSHQGENSLDFNMREGTEVRAARSGRVIAVVQRFNGNCWSDACKSMANYVLVYHSDGTIADYSHLQYNGARVMIGDSVVKGQLIAISGNTGYTRGPHLHFDCYLPGIESKRTLATRFRTGRGTTSAFLQEGRTYRKGY
ncbi:M23 family metallopeptidase [Sediminibacterium soli]|uniref:M23 family metallopeptidase n=1 Tax=Sediminibacterium soli TaxID=2698829 RepID=UPI00137B73AD|nr:M23 family metallopeptidase [Sediminibacterium soli]NCI47399.1 M23 family metallopeptidase [Sediminibacterium soli]